MDQQLPTFTPTPGMVQAGIDAMRACEGTLELAMADVFVAMLNEWCKENQFLFTPVDHLTTQ